MKPVSSFVVGREYTRNDIYEILDVPEAQQRGNWETGYNRYGDDLFLFPTVGSAATGGYDYANAWDGDELIWYAKNGTTLRQPLIQWMLSGQGRVFVFTREEVRQPFTFQGLGTPVSWEDASPVVIRWRLQRDAVADAAIYVVLFNEGASHRWGMMQYQRAVKATKEGSTFRKRWPVEAARTLNEGGRFFMLRRKDPPGIVGSGQLSISRARSQDGARQYVDLTFDVVLPPDLRLEMDTVLQAIPDYRWVGLFPISRLKDEVGQQLERLWSLHLSKAVFADFVSPDELLGNGTYREGAQQSVTVNRYERDRRARAACIAHWKAICSVCGFDFGNAYGDIGEGYIHVHHLKDLATIGEDYEVDPVNDLRPVCPNCHAMLHTQLPAMSLDDLKGIMAKQRKMTGIG